MFGPETSRTSVRGHREQFAILSREAIEIDGFHFLMSEPGAEDAVCCSRAKGDRLAYDSLAQAYGTAEDRAAERGGTRSPFPVLALSTPIFVDNAA